MTARAARLRRPAILLAAALAAGAWALALDRLWRTSVPTGLRLPSLDPRDFFSAARLDEAGDYAAFLRVDELLARLAQLAALAVFAFRGARFMRESAAGRIGTGMLLGMLSLGFVWFAEFPFALAAQWWERDHGTSHQGYLDWLLQYWASAGGEFLFISLALLVVMGLAGASRRFWWAGAVPALFAVAVAFAFVQPYLIPSQGPVRSPVLAADARELAAREGVPGTAVRVLDTGDAPPNALAAGLGPSRRIVLWDSLVHRFPRPQVRVVIAHELGHLAKHHIWKALAFGALLALPIALVVAYATRRWGGLYEPAAVPVAVFAVALLLFLTAPLQNAFSRRLEAEADWAALQATRDPAAAEGLFRGFTRVALADPAEPAWSTFLLADHPSIMSRIEMAVAWRQREGG